MNVLKDKKGMVLILVLSIVALFTAMIVSFSADESQDIELAYNFRDSLQAQYIARAGVEAASAIFAEDDPSYDSLDDKWANFGELSLASAAYLEGTHFTGNITDECGKFDLNSLALQDDYRQYRIAQFKRLFTILKVDISDEELNDLVNSIIDWIDADSEIVGMGGAEEDYYQSLTPPYHCKNAPMDCPEEILLVKGMKREYFYGTDNYEGIGKYVTVNTGGRININTASEVVLKSLSERFTEDVVNNILDCRPFKAKEFSCIHGLDLSQGSENTWLRSILDIKSNRFAANMKGIMPSGAVVDVKAILERINNLPRIVYYRIN
jgi:general secretion pathway protein K